MSKINVQNKIKSNFNYLEQLIKYADNQPSLTTTSRSKSVKVG